MAPALPAADDNNGPGIPPEGPSPLWFVRNEHQPGHSVFTECFKAIGGAHLNGVDTFTRRLASAVELLSEADRSDSTPIALTLCFAAIEAMICEDPAKVPPLAPIDVNKALRTDTTVQIKKYVPTLLMPSPLGRTKRGNVLYDLYMVRCDVIHGKRVAAQAVALHDVRQIASGVIRSAVHWRSVQRTNSESDTWEELFPRVNRAAFGKAEMADIPDLKSLLPGPKRAKHYR